jgi:hypothetical protein
MNWRALNKQLSSLSEDQVKALLEEEVAGAKRVTMVERLHQRYSALRVTRERLELLQACGGSRNG